MTEDLEVNNISAVITCSIRFMSHYLKNLAQGYVTNSGFSIIPYYHSSSGENAHGVGAPLFLIDINAYKGPNKWGYDIFILVFRKLRPVDSVFVVQPGEGCHALDLNGYYTKDFFNYLYGKSTNY